MPQYSVPPHSSSTAGKPAGRPPPDIPDHHLIRCIGRGSYGEVWLARNVVGTYRAVKVVYRADFQDSRPYEREFAGIQKYEPVSRSHESLTNVLQIGRPPEDEYFYYVMELADASDRDAAETPPTPGLQETAGAVGTPRPTRAGVLDPDRYVPCTLRSEVKRRGRLPLDECLEIGITLADAVEHLHRRQLVHRDIKPSNVIFVGGRPKLADIGLVAGMDEAKSLVGTEGFVAPEGPGTPRADIFGFGKLLYEISTGKDRGDYPAPLTSLAEEPDHARLTELNEVILRACETDPARRYPTMAALKAELLLVQAGESVQRARRLERRLARLRQVSLLGLILGAALAAASFVVHREREQRLQAEVDVQKSRVVAGENEARYNRELAALTTQLAAQQVETLFEADRSGEAIVHLARVLEQFPSNRVALARLISALTHRTFALPLTPALRHGAEVYCVRFSPDGERVVTTSKDGTARIWKARTGEAVTPPLPHGGRVRWGDFSPDGRLVATGSENGTARIWETASGAAASPVLQHTGEVWFVQFSPDGQSLVTASSDQTARIWSTATGQPMGKPLRHDARVNTAQFSPDGRMIVTASDDGTARVWEARTAGPVGPSLVHGRPGSDHPLAWAEFSPDGRLIVTASNDGTVRVWDMERGEPSGAAMEHQSWVRMAGFSPDGQRIATASWDGSARLWETRTGRPLSPPLRHSDRVRSARFSPDGLRLVTTATDHTVRVWDAFTGEPLTEPFLHSHRLRWAEFSPDGLGVATASEDGTAVVWDVRPGSEVVKPLYPRNEVRSIDLSRDGKLLALGMAGDGVAVHELATRRWIMGAFASQPCVTHVRFRPDGGAILAVSEDNSVRIWETQRGRRARLGETQNGRPLCGPLQHARPIVGAEFSPDGGRVVTASFDRTAQVWDAATGQRIGPALQHEGEVWSARFDRDGKRIVTASPDGTARVWDAASGRPLMPPLKHEAQVHYAEFSPDDRLVVTASNDTTVRLWDAETGQPVGFPLRHGRGVRLARFSGDGRRLLTLTEGDSAWVWDVQTRQRLVNPLRHHRTIRTAEFSPDGSTIVTGSDDRSLRLWDAETGQPVSEPVRHRGEVLASRFTGDGLSVVVGTGSAACSIYALPALTTPVPAWLPRLARALAGGLYDAEPASGPATLFELRSQSGGLPGGDSAARWARWFFADRAERGLSPFTLPSYTTGDRVDLLKTLRDPESLREWVYRRPDDSLAWSWIIGSSDRGQLVPRPLWRAAAECQLQRLATGNPDDRVALWAALEAWRVKAQLKAGMRWTEGLVARWPGSINAWSAKGVLFQWAGRKREAVEAFARALELTRSDPSDPAALRESMLLNRASLLKRLGRLDEARADYRSEWNVPPTNPQAADVVIDLSPYYNATLDEAWYDADAEGNRNLLPLLVGRHLGYEAFFDARALVQVAGGATAPAAAPFPDRVEGIPIETRCRRLHFLHGACGTDAPGTLVGTYVVHFSDGPVETIPVRYGVDVLDRRSRPETQPKLAPQSGWESRPNPAGEVVQLFHLRWYNPRPDVPIASLDFVSAGAAAAPFLVSLSWD